MPPSFTISEFSELVSAALDGHGCNSTSSFSSKAHGADGDKFCKSPFLEIPKTGGQDGWNGDARASTASKGRGDGETSKTKRKGTTPRCDDQRCRHHRDLDLSLNPYLEFNTNINIKSPPRMLVVQPPGAGPFPPPITKPPIVAATMSTVELGSNCLYLGSGGACGKFPVDESIVTTTTTTPPRPNPSGNDTPRHASLGLLSKIKRQLSKSNVRANASASAHANASATGNANTSFSGPNMLTLPTPNDATPTSPSSPHGPTVSFASSPSFYSASPSISTFTTCSLETCPEPGRSTDTPPSPGGSSSLLSLPSVYSRGSGEFIGSSSSFFAALQRGRDGRTGRRGSEATDEEDIDEIIDGELEIRSNGDETRRAPYAGAYSAGTVDLPLANDYAPYLPLIIQHERLQQRLQARISLDEVPSLSRTSLSLSSAHSASPNAQESESTIPAQVVEGKTPAKDGVKARKRVPPPLHASPLSDSRPRSGASFTHPYAYAQAPYSPASTASTRSPITPRTPFFVSSSEDEAELDENAPRVHSDEDLHQEEDHDIDDSGLSALSVSVSLRGRGSARSKRQASSIVSKAKSAHILPAVPVPPSTAIHVHVLPPTPTLAGLAPDFIAREQVAPATAATATTTTSVLDAIDAASAAASAAHTYSSPRSSISRIARNSATLKAVSPPMSPPPSGPLPLPPASFVHAEGSRPRIDNTATLAPSETSWEWPPHRHPSPFMSGSNSPGTSLLSISASSRSQAKHASDTEGREEDEDEDEDAHERVLHLVDDSGVVFYASDAEDDSELEREFFTAESASEHPSDDDDASDTDSLSLSRASDTLSSADASSRAYNSSDAAEEYARLLQLAANTSANARGHFFPVQPIGVGRQQGLKPQKGASGVDGSSELGSEWTLFLEASHSSSTSSSSLSPKKARGHGIILASAFARRSSDGPDLGPFSAAPLPVAPTNPIPIPIVFLESQEADSVSTDAAPVPVVSVTPPTDKASLRTRTKSESALGAKSKKNSGNGACKELPVPRGDDWTLSLPLPSSLTKIKTKGQSSSPESAPTIRKKASVITVAGVECLLDDSTSSGSVIDTDEEAHDCARSDSHPTTPVLPVVFSVPRVVSQGSGIERAARSKDKIKASVLPGEIDEDIFDESRIDANSAKLEILSADLERFNKMLRHGKSLLALRTKGSQHGGGEFSATHSLGVPAQGRSGLRYARSHGTIDVDDASPKKAILRIPSVGHLFSGDVKTKARAPVSPSTTLDVQSTEAAPAVAPGSVVIKNALPTPSSTDIAEFDEEAEALREVLPRAPAAALPASRSRVVSTASAASAASAATITPAKVRVRLPFASSSSVCGYTMAPPSPVSLRSSEVPCLESPVTHMRPGLASGSALNPRTIKRSRSTGTPHALTIVTTPSALIPRDSVVVPENDVSYGETTPTKVPSSVPIFSVPSSNFNIAPGSSTPSSPSTPTDFHPPVSLTPRSAPIQSYTSEHTRHESSSSLATITSISSPGSTSSKMPTGSPVYDSSAAPTPLASAFPIPPPFTGPPPSFGRSSGLQVATDLGISKDTPNRNAGVGPRPQDLPTSRSSSLSSSKSATAIMGPTRVVAPNLEQRIRQLRMLGVDAGMPAVAVVNSTTAAEKEAAAEKSEKEAETDADSVSSGPYYSARSSFSSER